MEKSQLNLHPNSEALVPGPPALPKKNPPLKPVLRRNRTTRCGMSKQKADNVHNFQRADNVNLEKLMPLPHPEHSLDRSFEMLSSDDW